MPHWHFIHWQVFCTIFLGHTLQWSNFSQIRCRSNICLHIERSQYCKVCQDYCSWVHSKDFHTSKSHLLGILKLQKIAWKVCWTGHEEIKLTTTSRGVHFPRFACASLKSVFLNFRWIITVDTIQFTSSRFFVITWITIWNYLRRKSFQ